MITLTALTNTKAAIRPHRIKRFKRPKNQTACIFAGTRSPLQTNISSKTKGTESRRANGQPTTAPIAKETTAERVLEVFDFDAGCTAYDSARSVKYIEKLDGKNAKTR